MLPKLDGMLGRVCYPVPSLDPADQRFEARRYRRGPDWAMMNAPIGPGLAARGRDAQAQALRRRTAHLIVGRGFAEYFDPLSRAPAGGGPSPGRRRCGWPGSRPLRGSGETGAIRLEGGEKRLGDLQVINSVDLEPATARASPSSAPLAAGSRPGCAESAGRRRSAASG
jgi:hypothetical protein